MRLILACVLALSGCAELGSLVRRLETCLPSAFDLVQVVAKVLLEGGDWKADLAALGSQYGADAVACAVAQLADEWGDTSPGAVTERTQRGIHAGYTNTEYNLGHARAVEFLR